MRLSFTSEKFFSLGYKFCECSHSSNYFRFIVEAKFEPTPFWLRGNCTPTSSVVLVKPDCYVEHGRRLVNYNGLFIALMVNCSRECYRKSFNKNALG